ncbi:phosphoenolpyruvate--protein phosphotransferase [Sphingomonas gilva]|uniref:phosphoenolpyruvate--protein phosphotransferase n=1 Tax=Sphingomonas gilva TaxID=2305907 RepID=A0A396RS19_9SPHN|nr:phosphoenolpyruvate--protein phosphotransferase [Sphingomonas gilva]RHW19464.1 phosphoenolpyruvate--protein phosphotransferase [Sphingomonas gilva]
MTEIRLGAPFAGWAVALDAVPDPVFAERMMGDGIAIDPLDPIVRAPCDAVVSAVAPSRHSVTLRLENGAEILIHIGLETVALKGAGFTALVAAGDEVEAGTPLIEIDLDAVARGARSLLTPITVANEGFAIDGLATNRKVAQGDAIFTVRAVGGAAAQADTGPDTARCELVIPLAHGIHARPAARIAAALKGFSAEVSLEAHGRAGNARSTVGLLSLGLRHGDSVAIVGRGADSRAAVTAIATLIEGGMGEAGEPAGEERRTAVAAPSSGPVFRGVTAAPGLAVGPAFHLVIPDIAVPERGAGAAAELTALDRALAEVDAALARTAEGEGGAIVAAHRALLDDPDLIAAVRADIAAGHSAGWAWRAATRRYAETIRATGDPLLIERIADLIDVERRVVSALLGGETPATPAAPAGAIVIAEELLPSQFLSLDPAAIGGICTAGGGPTSHVAILAAAAGVPMLVAAGAGVLAIDEGAEVILDADAATLDAAPDAAVRAAMDSRLSAHRERRAAEVEAAHADCVTADGARIEIFANLGSLDDATRAVAAGAEGCGLLRTEFLFLDRAEAPSEEEQREAYAAIAAALGGRPLIVRTLDIGGDKPVPYLPFPPEDNPALGARGIRLSLARPDLLRAQFRAILAGVPEEQCRIMLPMIVDRGEFAQARAMLDEAAAAVRCDRPPLGVMIETPAAALLAHDIAAEADFLSVGTNDLTQYALAADRGNPALAGRIDALHPAVLRLITLAGEGAAAHGRWLGVCGALASDPRAAAILIGLGVTELSASPAAVPALKAAVRALRTEDCRALARRALALGTAEAVRAMLEE